MSFPMYSYPNPPGPITWSGMSQQMSQLDPYAAPSPFPTVMPQQDPRTTPRPGPSTVPPPGDKARSTAALGFTALRAEKSIEEDKRIVIELGATGSDEVHAFGCDGCDAYPVTGPRYDCPDCGYAYNLCQPCYFKLKGKELEHDHPADGFVRGEEDLGFGSVHRWNEMSREKRQEFTQGGKQTGGDWFVLRTGFNDDDDEFEAIQEDFPFASKRLDEVQKEYLKTTKDRLPTWEERETENQWANLDPDARKFWMSHFGFKSEPTGPELWEAVQQEQEQEKREWEAFVYEVEDVSVCTLLILWPIARPSFSLIQEEFEYGRSDGDWSYFRDVIKQVIVNWALRVAVFASIVAQIMIPITVFVLQYQAYDLGFCPNTAEDGKRMLMLGIGLIYFPRLLIPNAAKMHSGEARKKAATDTTQNQSDFRIYPRSVERMIEPRIGSLLDFCLSCDQVMSYVYEPLVYMLNLWLVFVTDDELEMVLNALAMEFIMKVDEEFKEQLIRFIKAKGLDLTNLKAANRLQNDTLSGGDLCTPRLHPANHCKSPHAPVTWILKTVGRITLVLSPFVVLAGAIFGTACKP